MSQFHFVVRKIRTGIKEEAAPSFHVDAHVALPEIAMDNAWLELPAVGLQGLKEPWDDFPGYLVDSPFILWPRSVSLDIKFANAEEQVSIEDGPTLLPVNHMGPVAIAGLDGEPKHSSRRFAQLVQISEPARELGRVGCRGHIHDDELGEIEVGL